MDKQLTLSNFFPRKSRNPRAPSETGPVPMATDDSPVTTVPADNDRETTANADALVQQAVIPQTVVEDSIPAKGRGTGEACETLEPPDAREEARLNSPQAEGDSGEANERGLAESVNANETSVNDSGETNDTGVGDSDKANERGLGDSGEANERGVGDPVETDEAVQERPRESSEILDPAGVDGGHQETSPKLSPAATGRINSYSSPEYLLDIVDSSFGGLLQLPIWRSSLSGKLVHQVLCRSLITDKRHEMWFVYGGHLIRFSLREFAILTGLNCNPYPPEEQIKKMQTPRGNSDPYWTKLFGPCSSMNIRDIVVWLKRDKRLPKSKGINGEKRLRLAIIVIVEGILVCDSSNVRATRKVAEMLRDIHSFDSFPWGRLSFERTIAITYLLGPDDAQTFAFRYVHQLTMCMTFHNSNILETEMDEKLQVECILRMDDTLDLGTITWADEEEDYRVDIICDAIQYGHIFKVDDWYGGFSNLPSMVKSKEEPTATTVPNPKKPAAIVTKRKTKRVRPPQDVDQEPPNSVPDVLHEMDKSSWPGETTIWPVVHNRRRKGM
ncbi:hypothetical protein CARUB_v10011488mg [Capsella rubella]|uniref:DUF1985 domain-containing protein n=1 Tax=Capsella rubella TaxID=81985 RepID=R0IP98_9BRAS|nr:hypothetical protein CARUB_v10011488mg [Capsella rubella]